MTPTKKQLEELFVSVAKDTPTLEHEELRILLDQKTSGNLGIGPLATPITNRNRGLLKKGIITMTISAVLLTAFFLFFSNNNVKEIMKSSLKSNTIVSGKANIPINTFAPFKENEKKPDEPAKDSLWRYTGFNPIDLSCVHPIAINHEEMDRIGLLTKEDNEIIFYHEGTKVGFPTIKAARGYNDFEKDNHAKIFGSLPFFPSYATDSKGNLLMAYEYENTGSAISISVRLPEEDAARIGDKNYRRMPSSMSFNKKVDSSNEPWIITRHYHIRMGIMSTDTDMSCFKGESDNAQVHEIWENLARKDSLYKSQFGGEAGIETRFQFPTDTAQMSSEERSISDSLHNIEKLDKNRKDAIMKEILYCISLSDRAYPDTLKLKIEQLYLKIAMESALLEHQDQEKQLANITSLIPIQIRENTGLKADGKYDNGIILWYEPSKELFKALPQLQQTLSAEACTQTSDQKMQNVSIYPNPANLYLFINYTLASSVKVSISIWDLSGKVVAQNISSHVANSGENKESITISDIPPGVYLVILTTDGGDRSIQRLVITK